MVKTFKGNSSGHVVAIYKYGVNTLTCRKYGDTYYATLYGAVMQTAYSKDANEMNQYVLKNYLEKGFKKVK